MPREFYTERDIEDMFKRGIMSLAVNDQVVLTELAYEKARSLGLKLLRDKPDNPPSAPVRPYISRIPGTHSPAPAAATAVSPASAPAGSQITGAADGTGLQQRIREAVLTRLGPQVDAALLDVIIRRVLRSTGVR
jgi:hypothetical protein